MKKSFIFGNGFENEKRPENTHDPMVMSYVDDLEGQGIISSLKEIIVDLFEMTKLVGNGLDWIGSFPTDDVKAFLFSLESATLGPQLWDTIRNGLSLLWVPESIRPLLQEWQDYLRNYWGFFNNLTEEVIRKIEVQGDIEDGIAFVHSGATAPVLAAIEKMQYDVNTVIIYEGPHPDYQATFTNPNLKRIIHVLGTATALEGDAFVPYLNEAEFRGGVENINIKIEGAFHSDYSYDADVWDAKIAAVSGSTPAMVESTKNVLRAQKERNRRVSLFMRELYRATALDQTTPGRLEDFLRRTPGIDYNTETKFAKVVLGDLLLEGI